MFFQLIFPFLLSPVLLEARVVVAPDSSLVRRGKDSEIIAHFSIEGSCFGYFGPKNDALSFAPCKIYCPKTFPGSDPNLVGCKGPGMSAEAYPEKALIAKDEAGLQWVAGKCICAPALEIAVVILDVVVEALSKLDEVICAVMLSTLQLFVESVLDFVPVTAPVGAAVAAARVVEGAKTFVENGMEAASFFGNWIGPSCKIPDFDFGITHVFANIMKSPDDIGVSKGCFKKNKAECAKPTPVPRKASPPPEADPPKADPPKIDPPKAETPNVDPPKVDPPKVDPPKVDVDPPKADPAKPDTPASAPASPDLSRPATDAPAPTNPPATTKETDSKTESSASACKLARRAAPRSDGLIEGKLGEDMSHEDDCRGATTVHSTITQGPVGAYPEVIPMTCSKDWTQACYHYRSVMSVFTNNPDMVRWTCLETPKSSIAGKATNAWGSSAISTIAAKGQHWFPWVNGFVPWDKATTKGCGRDEWPPRFFWPGDAVAAKKNMVQRVRFILGTENGKAGNNLLRGFCDNNAAQTVKGQQTFLNPKFIKTINKKERTGPAVGGKTTIFTTVSVDTAHAVFTIVDWDGLPNDPDFNGLKDNPCWPKDLAPEDPGFALLTNDEFYQKGQHPELAQYTARYRELPDLQTLLAIMGGSAQAANFVPPFDVQSIDQVTYADRFARKPIPDEYRAILPGIPRPPATSGPAPAPAPAPPRRRMLPAQQIPAENGTFPRHAVDVAPRPDEEFNRWMKSYMEELKRQERSFKTVARTNAVPTPAGQGEPTASPAVVRTNLRIPLPTS